MSTDTTDDQGGNERLRAAGDDASKAVRQAADALERELSAGLDETRRMQRTAIDQRRIDAEEFRQVTDRLRRNAHDLIEMVGGRAGELTGGDVRDLSQRLSGDAHSVLDAIMDLVDAAPGVVNRLAARAEQATDPGARVDSTDAGSAAGSGGPAGPVDSGGADQRHEPPKPAGKRTTARAGAKRAAPAKGTSSAASTGKRAAAPRKAAKAASPRKAGR